MIYLIIPIVMFFILSGLAFFSFKFASTHQSEGQDSEPARRGCLLTLASLLLRPVPVIFAFYQFGFEAAVLFALAIWLILRCFGLYTGKTRSSADLRLSVLPIGAILTLCTGNFIYFQLIPSAWCVLSGLEQCVGLVLKKVHLFAGDSGETVFSEDETKLARWGIISASLVALLISEYVRHNFSLSSWVWYYGYLRLELLPIMLGSIAPAMIKMFKRSESEPR
ncbi:hypothetical protein [uncultured Tateyamaria sp.]|uniref:hypothetical protein n=1 Tax=uncultured Tateyamaria sp. TaxID=455651 RepID=UPI00260787F2|nr:hypothetical protein [uncultured Tateyamaria sp.]